MKTLLIRGTDFIFSKSGMVYAGTKAQPLWAAMNKPAGAKKFKSFKDALNNFTEDMARDRALDEDRKRRDGKK